MERACANASPCDHYYHHYHHHHHHHHVSSHPDGTMQTVFAHYSLDILSFHTLFLFELATRTSRCANLASHSGSVSTILWPPSGGCGHHIRYHIVSRPRPTSLSSHQFRWM